jgi:hypothetical protein
VSDARRKPIVAEPARRIEAAPPAPLDEVGQESGLVEVKARLPIHLHLAIVDCAERNLRSMAAEIQVAIRAHVENEARRRGTR